MLLFSIKLVLRQNVTGYMYVGAREIYLTAFFARLMIMVFIIQQNVPVDIY